MDKVKYAIVQGAIHSRSPLLKHQYDGLKQLLFQDSDFGPLESAVHSVESHPDNSRYLSSLQSILDQTTLNEDPVALALSIEVIRVVELLDSLEGAAPSIPSTKDGLILCAYCGEEQPARRLLCWNCSRTFVDSEFAPSSPPKSPESALATQGTLISGMQHQMYCMKCGTLLPEGAAFCFKCGTRVGTTGDHAAVGDITVGTGRGSVRPGEERVSAKPGTEWEYHTIETSAPKGSCFDVVEGADRTSEASARLTFWYKKQREIMAEVQPWLDKGWEPVGEIGPGSLVVTTSAEHAKGLLATVFGMSALGYSWWLIGVRISLRRRKR